MPRSSEYPRYNLQNTWNSRIRKTKEWILHTFLEGETKCPWKELQRQSSELRWKKDHPETVPPGDPSHIQPPNPGTIAYARKILSKGPWYGCLLWGFACSWQIQKWMLIVIYRMEHRAPNGGARESIQGAEGVCNTIDGTTIWTNQYPQGSCL